VVFGMGVAALGPALPRLAEHTGSTLSRISVVFTAAAAGYLLGSLAAGRLFDRLPGHRVLAAVLVLMAGMAVLIPVAGGVWLLTLLFLFFGVAQGIVEVGSNTLLLWVHTDHAGPYMNALTGEKAGNHMLVYMDTYVFGKGYLPTTAQAIDPKYSSIKFKK